MKEIKLTKGKVAFVSDEDFDLIGKFKWSAIKRNDQWYVQATIPLARFIMRPPFDMEVDHISRNPLDNTRENLRICTAMENIRNQGKKKRNKLGQPSASPYKGVYWHRFNKNWGASISIDGEKHYLGCFANEKEAAHNYDLAAIKFYGEYGHTNFPRISYSQEQIENFSLKPKRKKSSEYKGVQWRKDIKKWAASQCIKEKRIHLGYFDTEIGAANAYDAALIKAGMVKHNFP